MKRNAMLLFMLALCPHSMLSAQTLKDVVNPETQITWLGLDFSLLKVVADEGAWVNKTPGEMFKAWNQLMIDEQKKYNIAEALSRDQVKFALDVTMDHNAALPADNLFLAQATPETLPKDSDVPQVIKSYDFKGNKGIGVMFVAESFDKPAQQANWWVTFVNMETKEVVYIQKMSAESSGFGLRNYWSSTVYYIVKRIGSSEYKKWRKAVKSN